MSPVITFDPFATMPFTGYIDPSTGRQERYLSLAHFVHSERLSGVDERYRKYLLNLDDPELFRLEVDGVGFTGGDRPDWEALRPRLMYAGIFMQALSNREHYGQLIANAAQLSIAHCSFSSDAALAMGQFIDDLQAPQDKLKVVFLGGCVDQDYVSSCLEVIFAKRSPQCLLALEDDGCASCISAFARRHGSPFSMLSSSLSEQALAESIRLRCTHVFHFVGQNDSALNSGVVALLRNSGVTVSPIAPKP